MGREKRANWRERLKALDMTGPWDGEPDRELWEHLGLPCLVNRNPMGAWCGYVAVPPGHPAHRKHYDEVGVEVHGGLTYSEECQGQICHVPKPGEPDNVWWLGFDCGHCDDFIPEMDAIRRGYGWPFAGSGTYRDIAYAKAETVRLAEQLAALK